ncbi:MAG: SDR family oxidoreductase [Oscillatoriales cyanobacterium SM2_1_8]|nr:SDR family oxidoreductase [Oscillatoriales cyanobacterium SM2_1_8]
MTILVVGGTGRTGRRIVAELQRREMPVRVLVRDEALAHQVLPPGVAVQVADVTRPETLAPALAEGDRLVVATGANPAKDGLFGPLRIDFEGTRNLLAAAQTARIQHMVLVSSLCVSRLLHPLNLFGLVLYWKRRGERLLEASGIPYTIVRPGGLKEEGGGRPILQNADTLFEGSIPRTLVARLCVDAILEPRAHNRILEAIADPNLPDDLPFAELLP